MIPPLTALTISLVLLLAAFPLVSFGTATGTPVLWWLGLAAFALGGLIPPLKRFIPKKETLPPPTKVGLPEDERVS